MKRIFAATSLSVALLTCALLARQPQGAGAAPSPGSGAGTLENLAWIVGAWEGNGLGGDVEEYWSPAAGKSMMGTFRILNDDHTSLYEFLLIEEEPSKTMLRFKHFDPGYEPWEEKALSFKLMEVAFGKAVFEAEDKAQNPGRMTYSLTTDGKLSVVVSTFDKQGEQHEFGVKYTRRKQRPTGN